MPLTHVFSIIKPLLFQRDLWVAIVFVIALLSFALSVNNLNFEHHKEIYLNSVKKKQFEKIDRAKTTLELMAKFSYESIIFNNEIIALMAKAVDADADTQQALRLKLYRSLYRDYQFLKKYHVRQLHFHLPDSISFLRFHRPDKFGDSLKGIRPALDKLNQTKLPLSGFEEGRIFNGFRHIYPLFYNQKFVGSVEISYGLDAVSQVLNHNHQSSELFLISRKVIESKVFANELNNYETSAFSKDWLIDKVAVQDSESLNSLPKAVVDKINAALKDKLKALNENQPCSGCTTTVEVGQDMYSVTFSPIYNIDNKLVGFIISYEKELFLPILQSNKLRTQFILVLMSFGLSGLLYFWLRKRRRHVSKLEYSAHHDELTGLFNRKELVERLPDMLETESPIHVIFFDIDHFKSLNDTHGHLIGDEVLKELSQLVSKSLRENDLLVRWGGEEFVAILENTSLDHARLVAEKLRKTIEGHTFSQLNLKVTSSFGVTESVKGDTLESITDRADELLYEAKKWGRNQVITERVD